MADTDLTFESTTDTPEQMREGMGLPADAPVETSDEQTLTETPDPVVEPVAEPPATAVAEAAAGSVAPTKTPRPKDPVTGKFIATPKPDPIAEERAQRMVAETERDALKKRVEELAAAPAAKPDPVAPAPVVPAIDPETYQDAGVTAKFIAARTALGPEPKQEDFEDYTEFRSKERAYDRKLAALDARETDAHYNAGVAAQRNAQAGADAAREKFATFAERQNATKARHSDFDAVMEAGKNIKVNGPYFKDIQRAIVEMEEGPEVVYYLAKNPDLIETIVNKPSIYLALAELGRVVGVATAAVSAATAPSGATQTGPTTIVTTAKPVSKAPEPQGTVLGAGPSLTASTPENAKDYQEYKRIRESQIKARFGR